MVFRVYLQTNLVNIAKARAKKTQGFLYSKLSTVADRLVRTIFVRMRKKQSVAAGDRTSGRGPKHLGGYPIKIVWMSP